MKRYQVIIEISAQSDIETSYRWGCRQWGVLQANRWVREFRSACQQLTTLPERQPLAPEDAEFVETIRQMISGRYRILFTVKGNKVHILHIRGAHVPEE